MANIWGRGRNKTMQIHVTTCETNFASNNIYKQNIDYQNKVSRLCIIPEWQIIRAWTPPLPSRNSSISRACCKQKIRGRVNVQFVFQLIVFSQLSEACASMSHVCDCLLDSEPRLSVGILSDFSLLLHKP
jgi:hypothetical protein